MSDLGDWFKSVPFFTRYWFAGSIGCSVIGGFQLISPRNFLLLLEPLKSFQIWRLVTCVLYYPLGFPFLVNLHFLYTYSRRLEEGKFQGRPADYLFLLLFNLMCCVILGLIGGFPILMDPMVLSVIYVWSQLNKDVIVSFWFGTRFKATYLPWVLLGFNLLMGGGIAEFLGILVGHSYYFLMFQYPQELGGSALLQTPAFLKSWFPNQVGGVHGFGVPPQRTAGTGGGHSWGRGYTLGGN